ncbi:MAG: tetratricopeptide repeat protein [Verrucomicrobia bacterium]|nr:tetratricopeptide repeat protein [Verrucomicrobiota bacterium]
MLAQYRIAQVSLGRKALENGKAEVALEHFTKANQPPPNLGEDFRYLQSRSDLNYWKGRTLTMLGRQKEAEEAYAASANEAQDFKQMAVTSYSASTFCRGLWLPALERESEAYQLFSVLYQYGQQLRQLPGEIDCFATSLPNMLVFEDDSTPRNQVEGKFLQGLALLQLRDVAEAEACFREVLEFDPSHYEATDQLRALNVLNRSVTPPLTSQEPTS